MSEIKSIPVSELIIPPGTKVRAGLLKSVKMRGVLTPIIVSPASSGGYTPELRGYIVRDGRRRVKAAIEDGLETVPAVVLEDGGPEITILTHATRSENPVAELDAIQALQRSGMSEKEIASAGFAPVSRIRRLAKLNLLVPELAEKVDAGEIAVNLAFEIANLPPQVQRGLLDEEKITAETVRQAKYARRQAVIPDLADLVGEAQRQRMATFENVIGQLSAGTLKAVLADLPDEARFATWRAKFKRAFGELEFAQSIKVHHRSCREDRRHQRSDRVACGRRCETAGRVQAIPEYFTCACGKCRQTKRRFICLTISWPPIYFAALAARQPACCWPLKGWV